jgi:D-galactose 1-dehydrogenase
MSRLEAGDHAKSLRSLSTANADRTESEEMQAHRIGIIGLGKIAQDQHIPVIKADPAFELAAVASQRGLTVDGVPRAFRDHRQLLDLPALDAVAICTPQMRHRIALHALAAGKHVLLEKLPTATTSELADLRRVAERLGRTLFTTWHSQYNRAVDEAKRALAGQSVRRMLITWKEDVRKWHPGQRWIWQAGGFGVFDPGINALSIMTRILPDPAVVRRADLQFPSNADAPIAADIEFAAGAAETDLRAVFDWRQTGPQTWDIALETTGGATLDLSQGGSRLAIDGRLVVDEPPAEYQRIYERFDGLLRAGQSEVDEAPLRLVADAFLLGRRTAVEPFTD